MPILDTILAGLGLVGQAAQAITDPSLNEALSPASGLIVSPYYFQSIETEGRWKHQTWGYSEGRNLLPPEFDMPKDGDTTYPDDPATGIYSRLSRWKAFQESPTGEITSSGGPFIRTRRAELLRVYIGQLREESPGAIGTALKAADISPNLATYLNSTILANASFSVGAAWLVSQTEILGGYAGLFSATGFGSVYGHRAKVDIGGVSLGNYIPTAQLIGMSGYVNPVGPIFVEFRCAVVIVSGSGDPDVIPVYGTWWTRDSKSEREMKLDSSNSTWVIDMSDPYSPPK